MRNPKFLRKMNIGIKTLLLLSFSMMIGSCNGQENPKPVKKDIIGISEFQFFNPSIDPNDIDPYFTENNFLKTDHGPQSITRNILQDKSGRYWFATWNGIMSYDGKQFTNHTNQSGLRRYRVFCMLEDDDKILFGTIGAGLFTYDGSDFANITTKDGLGSDEIECMMKDQAGNIWLGTGEGVSVYDGENFQNYSIQDGLIDTDVHGIEEDSDGKIWIGSTGGISIYDPAVQGMGKKAFIEFKDAEGKSFNNVRTIIEDKDGAIWFGGNNGLIYLKNGKFTNLTTDFVGYLYEDMKGDILLNKPVPNEKGVTGLYRYRKGPLPHLISADNIEQIKEEEEMIFGFMEDDKGNIWYGRMNGVTRYDGKDFEYFR